MLIQIEEPTNISDNLLETLKQAITAEKLTLNPPFEGTKTIESYHNFIISSNKPNPTIIFPTLSAGERRFIFFAMINKNTKGIDDIEYREKLLNQDMKALHPYFEKNYRPFIEGVIREEHTKQFVFPNCYYTTPETINIKFNIDSIAKFWYQVLLTGKINGSSQNYPTFDFCNPVYVGGNSAFCINKEKLYEEYKENCKTSSTTPIAYNKFFEKSNLINIGESARSQHMNHNKVLGLSKLNRIVEFFAKRPQVQERLTEQICEAISFIAETDDVAVYIDAQHYCVKSRGIQDTGSSTVTLSTRGLFAEPESEVRREFLNIARMDQR